MSISFKDSVPAQIQILRRYLDLMEISIKADYEKYQVEKAELDNQVMELRNHIEEERRKAENFTEEEQERRFDEAYKKWEATWIDGDPYSSYSGIDSPSYYDSPEFQLEILEMELHDHEQWVLSFDFREVLRSSFFTHIYSFIEHSLNLKCDEVKIKKCCPVSVFEMKSQGIFGAKNYLQIVANIDLKSITEWSEIENYNKVRNCLVHTRGIILRSRDAKDLRKYIPKVDLDIDSQGKIQIKEAYCIKALDTIEKFFIELEKQIAVL